MSDDEDLLEQYRRFMYLAKITTGCPACGNMGWTISSDGGGVNIPSPDGRYYPAIMVSCSRCGNIRTHLRSTFDSVLKEDAGPDE